MTVTLVSPLPVKYASTSKLRFCARQSKKSGPAMVVLRAPVLRLVLVTTITRSGWSNGIGRRTTALTTLKIAVVAPMPSARVRMAVAAKPGWRIRVRMP